MSQTARKKTQKQSLDSGWVFSHDEEHWASDIYPSREEAIHEAYNDDPGVSWYIGKADRITFDDFENLLPSGDGIFDAIAEGMYDVLGDVDFDDDLRRCVSEEEIEEVMKNALRALLKANAWFSNCYKVDDIETIERAVVE